MATMERPRQQQQQQQLGTVDEVEALRSTVPTMPPRELLEHEEELDEGDGEHEDGSAGWETVQSLQSAQSAFLEILLSLINPPPLIQFDDSVDVAADPFAVAKASIASSHPAAAETARQRCSDDDSPLVQLLALVDIVSSTLPSSTDTDLARALGSLLDCFDRLLNLAWQPRTPSVASQANTPRAMATARMERSSSAPGNGGGPRDWGGVGFYEAIQKEARALQETDHEPVSARRQLHNAEGEYLWGKVDDLLDAVGDLCRQRMEQGMASPEASSSTADHSSVDGKVRTSTDSRADALPLYSPGSFITSPNLPHYRDSIDAKSILSTRTYDRPPSLSRPSFATLRDGGAATHGEKMQRELESVTSAIDRLYRTTPQLANQRASLVSPSATSSRGNKAIPSTRQRIDPARRQELRDRQLEAVFIAIERLGSRGRMDSQRASVPDGVAEGIIGMGWEGTRNERIRKEREGELRTMWERIDRAAGRRLDQQRATSSTIKSPPKLVPDGRSKSYTGSSTNGPEVGFAEFINAQGTGSGEGDELEEAEDKRLRELRCAGPRSLSMPMGDAQSTTLRKRLSTALLSRPSNDPVERSPVRGGFLGKGKRSSPAMSRRESLANGSPTAGRSDSFVDQPQQQRRWIVEEQSRLGTMTAMVEADVKKVQLESDGRAAVVEPGAWRLELPSPAESSVQPVIVHKPDHVEVRFKSASTAAKPPDATAPYSASDLSTLRPAAIRCGNCDATAVDTTGIERWRNLPSEHWRELLDAWMCHGDQELSDEMAGKGRRLRPRQAEGLVGTGVIVVDARLAPTLVRRQEVKKVFDEEDYEAVACGTCAASLGHATKDSVRLDKVSVVVDGSEPPVGSVVAAQMLELADSHGTHRFLIESEEEGQIVAAVWVFNPSLRFSAAGLPAHQAIKVLYLTDPSSPAWESFLSSPQLERLALPKLASAKLLAALDASNARYPPSCRHLFDGMKVATVSRL